MAEESTLTFLFTDVEGSTQVEALNQQTNQMRLIKKMESERDNLRAAIEWALAHKPETALEIIGKAYFWRLYSYASEGLRWLEEGIDKSSRLPEETHEDALRRKHVLAWAYWGKAILLSAMGRNSDVISALEESI